MFGVGVLTGASLNVPQTHSLGSFSCITKTVSAYSCFLITSNTSWARISPVPKSAKSRLWFPKSAVHMQVMAVLSLVPAGSQGWLECRHPSNTPSLAFCSPGDCSQLLPARERSDAISIWQCWLAPEGLCRR